MNDSSPTLDPATFAGGCFWCLEADFKKYDGIVEVISGYAGGHRIDPTYDEVTSGQTGHAEAIQVHFNPVQISYQQLLDIFWQHVDPTDPGGQFVDRGAQYRTAIFYHTAEQQRLATASRDQIVASNRYKHRIVTEITPVGTFYPAEEYHQNYFQKNPLRYKFYRYNSGRDQFLNQVWRSRRDMAGSKNEQRQRYIRPDDSRIRDVLTELQYRVTQMEGTEPPFNNAYWDNHQEGIYVDIVSGEPLFSSRDKFDSGSGWPSFSQPLEPDHIVKCKDRSLFMTRIEVRSRYADSHLGHVFKDGPPPSGLRYCVNSAALRFIRRTELEKTGYGHYRQLF